MKAYQLVVDLVLTVTMVAVHMVGQVVAVETVFALPVDTVFAVWADMVSAAVAEDTVSVAAAADTVFALRADTVSGAVAVVEVMDKVSVLVPDVALKVSEESRAELSMLEVYKMDAEEKLVEL